jgi:hypothetical protein
MDARAKGKIHRGAGQDLTQLAQRGEGQLRRRNQEHSQERGWAAEPGCGAVGAERQSGDWRSQGTAKSIGRIADAELLLRLGGAFVGRRLAAFADCCS